MNSSHDTSRFQASSDICQLVAEGKRVPDYLNEYTLYNLENGELFPFLSPILSDDFISVYNLNPETLSEVISTPPDWLGDLRPICLDCLALLATGSLKRGSSPSLSQL